MSEFCTIRTICMGESRTEGALRTDIVRGNKVFNCVARKRPTESSPFSMHTSASEGNQARYTDDVVQLLVARKDLDKADELEAVSVREELFINITRHGENKVNELKI